MVDSSIVSGRFTIAEAAKLSQLNPRRVREWYTTRDVLKPEWSDELDRKDGRPCSFRDIVALQTLRMLRDDYRVSLQQIRKAAAWLHERYESPFSELRFSRQGKHILFRDRNSELKVTVKPVGQAILPETLEEIASNVADTAGHIVALNGWKNRLIFGDNLEVLRADSSSEVYIPSESVDLIYLDPPFKSNAIYNVFYRDRSGAESTAQITAFEDTWKWGPEAEAAFRDVVLRGGKISRLIQAFRAFLDQSNMMAYVAMMAPRLVELHRVLKPTGSLYLHCDPTASHYLKLILDATFGPECFRSEIVWKRSSAHSDTKQGRKVHGHIHDVILFYSKGDEWTWNPVYTDYDQEYVDAFYRHIEPESGRRFRISDLTAAKGGGDTSYGWRVKRSRTDLGDWEADLEDEHLIPRDGFEYSVAFPYKGRFWAYSKGNMIAFEREGRIYYTRNGMPNYKRYLDEMRGVAIQDLWTDIPPSLGDESLGYPTQKPSALLERIIRASSNPGDVVLDPFCGCGTSIAVAESLGRRWIGIDVTHLAIAVMRERLHGAFEEDLAPFEVLGVPKDVESARALANEDRHHFEWWAVGLVEARPANDKKKGADDGIDGIMRFMPPGSESAEEIIVQVKSGKVSVKDVRELKAVVDREKAAIGVYVTLDAPTRPMIEEAVSAGYYEFEAVSTFAYPKIQILTIEDLLAGVKVDYPRFVEVVTSPRVPRLRKVTDMEQRRLVG